MTETIMVAIITGLFAVLGQYMLSRNQCKQRSIEEARREQQLLDRLDKLEEKVMLHNNVIERVYELEKCQAICKAKLGDDE